jgi:hypothetical protein
MAKVNTAESYSNKKVEDYNITPCDVIFNHTEKPADYLYCRSINIFDDRWRVNIYSKVFVDGIEGKRISKSFFTHFNKANGELKIVSA